MDINEQIRLNKKFGYSLSGVLVAIAIYHAVFKHQYNNRLLLVIALMLLLFTVVKPVWLTIPRTVWDKIGHVLGTINTYVLLTLFYFLIMAPLGFFMRLTGRDTLNLKRLPDKETYWEDTAKATNRDMKNQF